jgi:hypothetical protein
MSTNTVATDGSAAADAHDTVEIDRSDDAQRWRYRCPNGHTDWSPTNSHVWCKGCRRAVEAGEDVDPEHYELVDQKTGETIPWSAIELVEPERPRHSI